MAKNKILGSLFYLLGSFILGFVFILFLLLIVGGGILIKNINNQADLKPDSSLVYENLATYESGNFTISFPENYQLSKNKIIATDGIVIDQENTIHLISPPLNENGENLSLIITYVPYVNYLEEKDESTTCPILYEKTLEAIKIGNLTFTTSGQIFCGPDEVAFFYLLHDDTIYEVKVETTADYELEALPQILKILNTIKFTEQ